MLIVLRFLANVFFMVAIIALVIDATPALQGIDHFKLKAFATHWAELSPKSLKVFEETVTNVAGPFVWTYIVSTILNISTAILFAILGVLFGYLGRRRKRTNIFVN